MISPKILKFLEKNKTPKSRRDRGPGPKSLGIKYEPVKHKIVYTAFDKAATLRVKPNIIGKTLVLKCDKGLIIVLIPGNKNLDKNKFRKVAKTKKVDFISEKVMKNKFKGIKLGAIPPFGSLWKLQTFMDRGLLKNPKIIINSGDYNWSIKITPANFKKLVPDLTIGNFSKAK